jgi:hypothetical protein|tara:strand:+ start:669 stop:1133 length:465 start_codon:yes stop_codon:yes gene_type:complete
MSNKLPSKKVRQLGPDVWTFNGYDEQVDIGTEWITVAQGPINNSLELITAIAGDKMEAYDYDPPVPYPDEPFQLDSVEQTAWADLKSKPDYIENVRCVKLYQLVGRYYKYDEVEYQKGVDDNSLSPIPELGLIKTSSKTRISTQAEFNKAVKKD